MGMREISFIRSEPANTEKEEERNNSTPAHGNNATSAPQAMMSPRPTTGSQVLECNCGCGRK